MEEKSIMIWDEAYVKMMTTLRRYVTQLQANQSPDALGRVIALVNPIAILATGFTMPIDEFLDSPPQQAILHVSYLEGLPTIEGIPIWEKLEGEKLEYYEIFKRYRSMKDAKTPRTVYKLSVELGCDVKFVELLRQVYHWGVRVQAYDEYLAAERSVQLEMRRLEIEGKHARTADNLFDISSKYLIDHPEMLTPKLALQMLDVATRLQRISSGLSPDNRQTTNGSDRPLIAIQNNVGGSEAISAETKTIPSNLNEGKQRLSQMLNIMNNVGILQEPSKIIEVEENEE